ncbi:MAG TPA: hypothetical protein VJN21_00645 [Candidatus Acidoferrales bacterium]|nr:hypothetical protein [Candidatus Acidoferrales bacterium]
MTFWDEVLAIFTGDIFASVLIILFYAIIQWFLRATDVRIGYSWKWKDSNFHPFFDVRNQSGSRSYLLGNISYTKNEGKEILFIDPKSIWGKELKPGSINLIDADPVPGVSSIPDSVNLEVTIRLQNGRQFWLKGAGPGQLRMGRVQRIAFWLRAKCEKAAIPLE